MKILSLSVADLRHLAVTTDGELYKAIQDRLHAGCEPELTVRRKIVEGQFPRWTVSVGSADDVASASYEVTDPHGIAVLAGILLADLRDEIADEVRRRLASERVPS